LYVHFLIIVTSVFSSPVIPPLSAA